jgi:type I restriction enzyme R subunit
MQSKNFEFLRPYWEDLANLGASAEQYANPDPQGAVSKLRTYGDQITLFIYHHHGLPKPCQANLNNLLKKTIVRLAAEVAGLKFGKDIIVEF